MREYKLNEYDSTEEANGQNLPQKVSVWSKIKNFLFQEIDLSKPITLELTPKEERSNRLIELSDRNELDFQKQYLEKEVDVLFEEKVNDLYKGHTANYIMVNVKADKDIINEIKTVKLTDIKDNEMYGKIK